jgi:hypothetical protein
MGRKKIYDENHSTFGEKSKTKFKIINSKNFETWHIYSVYVYGITYKSWYAKSFLKNTKMKKNHIHVVKDKNSKILSRSAHPSEIEYGLFDGFDAEFLL